MDIMAPIKKLPVWVARSKHGYRSGAVGAVGPVGWRPGVEPVGWRGGFFLKKPTPRDLWLIRRGRILI